MFFETVFTLNALKGPLLYCFSSIYYRSQIQCIWKVFIPLHFFHIFVCYSLILIWIKLICFLNILHTIPHNDKVKKVFKSFLQMN